MRWPGHPQDFFANESPLDLIAKKLGMDRIKFRQKNFMHDGDVDPTGEKSDYIKTDETLDLALKEAGFYKPKAKNVGRGVALVQWTPNGGSGTVGNTIDAKGEGMSSSSKLDQ